MPRARYKEAEPIKILFFLGILADTIYFQLEHGDENNNFTCLISEGTNPSHHFKTLE